MDDPDPIITILIFTLTVIVYQIFLLANFAVGRSRASRINELGENGCSQAKYARLILKRRDDYFLATLLALFMVSAFWSTWLYQHYSASLGGRSEYSFSYATALIPAVYTTGMLFLAILTTFFLTQVIRAVIHQEAEQLLCIFGKPLYILSQPFLFLVLFAAIPARYIVRRLGIKTLDYDAPITADQLSELVGLSGEAGILEEQECEMIRSIFSFSNTLAREVMTPRSDVVTISDEASLPEVVDTFRQHAVSRLVVIGNNLDDVKGLLIAKDLVPLIGKEFNDFSVKGALRSASFVKGDKKIDQLFEEMRRQRVHLAIVLDEHGGVDGVITVEDLIEELVGEIMDEHDRPEDELQVTKTKTGDLLVSGALLVTDLNEHFDLALPPGEYDTVAGYVIQQLGRMPKSGDSVSFNHHVIRVEATKNNRITRLRIASS